MRIRSCLKLFALSPAASAVIGIAVAVAALASGSEVEAKAAYDSPYSYDQTWNAALRMVRVDYGLKVTEKDDANGYILFEYKSQESGDKSSPGSVELIRPKDPLSPTHVVANLPAMPRYHEQVMVDALSRKLRDDFGEPMKRPKNIEKADAGAPSQ